MRQSGSVDKEKLRAQANAVSPIEADARAEQEAVKLGTLDQDDRTSLRVIEAKFEHMATKAELTATVQALEASFGSLKTWALGLIIATLVAVIGVLIRLVIGLWLSNEP